MMLLSTYYRVDEYNIGHVRDNISARDQAEALELGCETWGIVTDGNRYGQMTRWPNGRGAIAYNGDSLWGDWYGDVLVLDEDGFVVDAGGSPVAVCRRLVSLDRSHPPRPLTGTGGDSIDNP